MTSTNTLIEKAWLEYQSRLLSFIRSKVDSVEDAEDILNDVFESLIKKSGDKSPDNIAPWLYRVTRNKIVDYYRARQRFEELPEDLASENAGITITEELSSCVLPMIMALPENYQQPLILSEIEGKKNQDVATELGLSLPAVKSRILRGREKLQQSIVNCCTLYRDSAGRIMDYEEKGVTKCGDC